MSFNRSNNGLPSLQLEVSLSFLQPFAACPGVRPNGEMLI